MNFGKDILEMDRYELYKNRKQFTKEDKIRLATSARKNLADFPDEDVYICDALSLVPRKTYCFRVEQLSQSSNKKMCAVIRIPYGNGSIAVGESYSKGAVFWFLEGYKCYEFKVKTNFGRVIIDYALEVKDHRGQNMLFDSGPAMGMKIDEVAECKKIYHCTEYGLPADFQKLVFSIEWNMTAE